MTSYPLILSASHLDRLALIRFLHGLANEQCKLPEPMNAVALLSFHDAVDWYLQLLAEAVGVGAKPGKKSPYLHETWAQLTHPDISMPLSQDTGIGKLITLRNNLKHQGILPNTQEIDSIRASISEFFEQSSKTILELSFGQISLSNLIRNKQVSAEMDGMDAAITAGQSETATVHAARAFYWVCDEFIQDANTAGVGKFSASGLRNPYELRSRTPFGADPFTKWMNELTKRLDGQAELMTVMAIGLELKSYLRYRSLTPSVVRIWGSKQLDVFLPMRESEITSGDVDFCKGFVTQAAIRVQSLSAGKRAVSVRDEGPLDTKG